MAWVGLRVLTFCQDRVSCHLCSWRRSSCPSGQDLTGLCGPADDSEKRLLVPIRFLSRNVFGLRPGSRFFVIFCNLQHSGEQLTDDSVCRNSKRGRWDIAYKFGAGFSAAIPSVDMCSFTSKVCTMCILAFCCSSWWDFNRCPFGLPLLGAVGPQTFLPWILFWPLAVASQLGAASYLLGSHPMVVWRLGDISLNT